MSGVDALLLTHKLIYAQFLQDSRIDVVDVLKIRQKKSISICIDNLHVLKNR